MKKLIFIRHGLTAANVRHLYCGVTDLPLCEEGRKDLEQKKSSCRYPSADGCRVYTSGLLRAEQTLQLLYGNLPHESLSALHEVNFGIFEMQGYEQLKSHEDYQAWLSGDWYGNVPPGGESFLAAEQRIRTCLQALFEKDEYALIVAHGGTGIVLMQMLFPEEEKDGTQWQPKNGCGYEIDLEKHTYQTIPFGV